MPNDNINIEGYEIASTFNRRLHLHGPIWNGIYVARIIENKSKELVIECSAVRIKDMNLKVIKIYQPTPFQGSIDDFLRILGTILHETFSDNTRNIILLCGGFNRSK